ncbi:MAG: TonB-dependent receptor [Sphingobium sp.]
MKAKLLVGTALLCGLFPVAAQADDAADNADAIVVTGQRAQQQRAIEAKRISIGVLDVAAADEIGRLPDRNVAEVLDRVAGVGVLYDQGEGRYVSVRGVPAELNGYTVNGFEIGNPDASTRALPLDVISGQLLNRVEVVKVKTADYDGQGIGGVTNLVTNTAFDFSEPFVVQASGQAGTQQLNDKVPVRGDVSVGRRFGADEQFGILLGASYSDRPFRSYGFFPDDWVYNDDAARGGVPKNIKYSEYNIDRARHGAAASLDWRPNENTQFYARGIYSKVIEDENRQRFRMDFGTYDFNDDGYTGTSSNTAQRSDLRVDHNTKSVLTGMLGGQTRADRWTIDFGGAYVHNVYHEYEGVWQFRGNPGDATFDFTDKVYTAAPVTGLTPDGLEFRQYTLRDTVGTEDTWQGRVDARYDLGGESFIKVGAKYRSTDKKYDQTLSLYTRGASGDRFSLADYDLAGTDMTVYPVSGRPYVISPVIDTGAMQAFTNQYLGSAMMVLDEGATLANNTVSDYDMTEKVAAGYVFANIEMGDITLTPGLRFEHTELDVSGFSLQDGTNVVPVSGNSSYDNWLPSLVVRVKPADDVILRAAYSRSVGRPQYESMSPGSSLSTVEDSVSLGNPNLKPYVADALDMSAEWYFARGGLISVAAFAKFIKDPIFTQTFLVNDVTYAGTHYDTLEFTQPLNADKGSIVGLEASYQQQFTFLPGLLSGFGINLNVTLTDSDLRVPGRGNSTFPNQSNFIYGAQLFYQHGPVQASVAFHNTGRSLLSLGDIPLNDQFSDDYRRLDAKFNFAVTENFNIFFEGQNLTDEPTRQYQADNRNWTIQNERYGRAFYAGASVKF